MYAYNPLINNKTFFQIGFCSQLAKPDLISSLKKKKSKKRIWKYITEMDKIIFYKQQKQTNKTTKKSKPSTDPYLPYSLSLDFLAIISL